MFRPSNFWGTDHYKDGLIARLAAQVSDFYDSAVRSGMSSLNIPADWITHITAKKLHFYAAAQYRKSIDIVSGSTSNAHYGEEVARLEEALRTVNKALEKKNFLGKVVRDDLVGLQSTLQRDTERAIKDNDLIYNGTTSFSQQVSYNSDCSAIFIASTHRQGTDGEISCSH